MEELIHIERSGEETVTFPKLKFLTLRGLPQLLGLCRNVNIIELPQLIELILDHIPGFTSIYPPESRIETSSLFKEEVVIPKLEKLDIHNMENLKEIWPCEFSKSERVGLRKITVRSCKNLVIMFPCNPMSLLHYLEEIDLSDCGSIERLFDIDLGNIGETGESSSSSSLKSIRVNGLQNLREVWRIKGATKSCLPVSGFQAVESINIRDCKMFRNVFTPTNTNVDLGAIMEISIMDCGKNRRNNELVESSHKQEQTEILLKEEATRITYSISNVFVFPSSLTHAFPNLRKVKLCKYKGVDVVFEIESPTTQHNQLLPYLEDLDIEQMEGMSHVWKCNWNKFFILQKQQSESPFHNLTTINLNRCNNIKYLFSPLMAKLLSKLKKVMIDRCDGIEEVVSNRDDEVKTTFTSTSIRTTTTLFPHLDSLTLEYLDNLKCIGGGCAKDGSNEISFDNTTISTTSFNQIEFSEASDGVPWSLCQYPREIIIYGCGALSSVIPCYAAGQMQKLQVLKIVSCWKMEEVFETQGMNNKNKSGCDDGNGGIPRPNNVFMLPNLKILKIYYCPVLEHIFTFSALDSLRQLQELTIERCKAMKVIVKEEEYDEIQTTTKASSKEVVVFPRLKSITLEDLPELMGFFLGMNEFRWPSLDHVMIQSCPQMRVFAPGGSTTPKLKYIHTILGKHSLEECGLDFHRTIGEHYQTPFPSSLPATSEGMPWSFHNLMELDVNFNHNIQKLIPFTELPQLQKMETINVSYCDLIEEVFEALEEGTNSSSGFDESRTTIFKLPNLTQVDLKILEGLRYIWKSNQWTVFEFPNLTKVYIHKCDMLEHVFTSSMVGSLLQLQELSIQYCSQMVEAIGKDRKVVVEEEEEEEESDGKTNEITLPHLKSLNLYNLPCLKGFCLGKQDFSFPLLDTLSIKYCPAITTFTTGNSATPQLIEIDSLFGPFYVAGKDINSIIKIKIKQEDSEGDSETRSKLLNIIGDA
ncbi:hypothetical protein L1887_06419 [Cichorium endivia]|nr:hypothetical protein L1887_06419 [Cichorium endivia]